MQTFAPRDVSRNDKAKATSLFRNHAGVQQIPTAQQAAGVAKLIAQRRKRVLDPTSDEANDVASILDLVNPIHATSSPNETNDVGPISPTDETNDNSPTSIDESNSLISKPAAGSLKQWTGKNTAVQDFAQTPFGDANANIPIAHAPIANDNPQPLTSIGAMHSGFGNEAFAAAGTNGTLIHSSEDMLRQSTFGNAAVVREASEKAVDLHTPKSGATATDAPQTQAGKKESAEVSQATLSADESSHGTVKREPVVARRQVSPESDKKTIARTSEAESVDTTVREPIAQNEKGVSAAAENVTGSEKLAGHSQDESIALAGITTPETDLMPSLKDWLGPVEAGPSQVQDESPAAKEETEAELAAPMFDSQDIRSEFVETTQSEPVAPSNLNPTTSSRTRAAVEEIPRSTSGADLQRKDDQRPSAD
ncbi:MAG: hypothetical protein WCH39_29645, partial [Schlesneria sp.]